MSSEKISKKCKIGNGVYGMVYKAEIEKKNGKVREVAVKRNWSDPSSIGTSTIREMNFLMSVKHPCITKCKKITCGDPFTKETALTPRARRNKMKEDKYLFVMEFVEMNLEKYYFKANNFYHLSTIMCEVLLGLEFLHARGIVHRDLKPPNILVKIDENIPYAKICDFGLTTYTSNYRPSTPGTVTSYYRAPEICCEYDNYSCPIDMWSIGCVFYEIVTKRPLIQIDRDTDKSIFREIIKKIPQKLTTKYILDYIKKGDIDRFKPNYSELIDKNKPSFKEKIAQKIDISHFERDEVDINQFCDLLDNIMILDPNKRFTATQSLDHPFFDSFREDFIVNMREEYPPIKIENQKIKIIDCIERRWAVNIAFKIYNKRDELEWCGAPGHLIFHSLRIFDEYLSQYYEEAKKREESDSQMGKMLSKSDVTLQYFTCIYICYKYFSALYEMHPWKKIFPKFITNNSSNLEKIINFENFILKYVCKFILFRPTMIEYLDDDFSSRGEVSDEEKELDVKIFLYNYGNLDMNYEGTMKDLYEQIKRKKEKK